MEQLWFCAFIQILFLSLYLGEKQNIPHLLNEPRKPPTAPRMCLYIRVCSVKLTKRYKVHAERLHSRWTLSLGFTLISCKPEHRAFKITRTALLKASGSYKNFGRISAAIFFFFHCSTKVSVQMCRSYQKQHEEALDFPTDKSRNCPIYKRRTSAQQKLRSQKQGLIH